jgi:uncharacterized protein YdhG (YjbR/CyaY superfamily)
METKQDHPTTVGEYISQYPEDVQQILRQIRAVIKESAPEAEERISYRMPGYFLNGPLVYFAAFEHHIGFYPTGAGIEAFKEQLGTYKWSKGAVQFPLDRPIPYDLIITIVERRVTENRQKTKHRRAKG